MFYRGRLKTESMAGKNRGFNGLSFNGKLRDKLINSEIFTTLLEAKVPIENWRKEYNRIRPYSSLGYRAPAPEAIQPAPMAATLTS